jgi:leucyl/phenylalanyl-tRNA--protein transferase
VLWWSPNPREVLDPREFKCSRSLAKTLRNRGFEVAFDRDFAAVVQACAARRDNSPGTWITPEMHAAYCTLFQRGHAHSVEVRLAGQLVGGLYGVLLGGVFLRRIDVQPRSGTPRKWPWPGSWRKGSLRASN